MNFCSKQISVDHHDDDCRRQQSKNNTNNKFDESILIDMLQNDPSLRSLLNQLKFSCSSSSVFLTSSSSPTQSRYEHSLPQPDKNKQFFRKFTAYKNYETPSSSDSSPSASPYVGRKKKRSIPLETTTTTTTDNQSQQQQSDQISINLVKDPTNTNKNLTNLTNIIVNLDKIDIDANVKMP